MQALRGSRAEWSVENFADEVNELVSWYLPDADGGPSSARVSSEFTVRSLRHYQNEGVIDPPEREGKEARYGYRHLLQALLVRRLLWEGHGRSTIGTLLAGRSDEDYEHLLERGVQITAAPANPAMAYLEKIRSRTESAVVREAPPSAPSYSRRRPASARPTSHAWLRHEVTEGLELHVSSNSRPPTSLKERQEIAEHILNFLEGLRPH